MQARGLVADLEDELGRARVDVGARVGDPAGKGVGGGGFRGDGDAAFEEVAEAEGDLVAAAGLVVGQGVGDEALLEAFEVEVAAVLQELGAVGLGADGDGVAAEKLEDLGKGVGAAVGDRGGDDGGRAEEALAVEAGEEVVGAGEEDGEAEGEEVGRVARAGEEVARDLELAVADRGEDGFLVELGDQPGEAVELGVGEEADKVGAIAGLDVVALEVQRDVPEGDGVTVDVEGPDGVTRVLAGLLGALELGYKVVREVGGCCGGLSVVLCRGSGPKSVPSEEREAPESLNSSEPIWMGKTRSWGRIFGILETRSRSDGWGVGCCWWCEEPMGGIGCFDREGVDLDEPGYCWFGSMGEVLVSDQ